LNHQGTHSTGLGAGSDTKVRKAESADYADFRQPYASFRTEARRVLLGSEKSRVFWTLGPCNLWIPFFLSLRLVATSSCHIWTPPACKGEERRGGTWLRSYIRPVRWASQRSPGLDGNPRVWFSCSFRRPLRP